jgi:hypothetical protein
VIPLCSGIVSIQVSVSSALVMTHSALRGVPIRLPEHLKRLPVSRRGTNGSPGSMATLRRGR